MFVATATISKQYAHTGQTAVADVLEPIAIMRRTATIAEALRALRERGSTALAVDLLRPGEAYGLLTTRDLQRATVELHADPETARLESLMRRGALMVAPEMRLEDCATLLAQSGTRHALVVRGNLPIGVVSDTAIFQAIEAR